MQTTIQTAGDYAPDWHANGTDRVVQNVRNLLALTRYEVAYNRTLGPDPGLLDRPAPEAAALFAAAAAELISANEPRASIGEVTLLDTTGNGEISFEVVVDVVT